MTLPARFMKKVEIQSDGCWLWTGAVSNTYGSFGWDGRSQRAHRVAYELRVGPIPAGLDIDHLCRNRLCVNVEHLEPVTRRENLMRSPIAPASLNARKTHCKRGHKFTAENTGRDQRGDRWCKACRRNRTQRRQVVAA